MQIKLATKKENVSLMEQVVKDVINNFFHVDIYLGRKAPKMAKVTCDITVNVGGSWHDYNTPAATIIRDGEVIWERHGCIYDCLINASAQTKEFMKGMKVELQPNDKLVILNSYPASVRIIVHPMAFNYEYVELSLEAAILLRAKKKCQQTAMNPEVNKKALTELFTKKFITSKENITKKGKEVATNIDDKELEFLLEIKGTQIFF